MSNSRKMIEIIQENNQEEQEISTQTQNNTSGIKEEVASEASVISINNDPERNVLQKAGNGMYHIIIDGVGPAFFFGGILPRAPELFSRMVEYVAVNANMKFDDAIRGLLGKQDPLAYLRAEGNGKVAVGLAKESAKFVFSMMPLAGLGLVGGYIVINTENNDVSISAAVQYLSLSKAIESLPDVARILVNGTFAGLTGMLLTYVVTKAIFNKCCVSASELKENDHEQHKVQWVVSELVARPAQAVMTFNLFTALLKLCTQETFVHHPAYEALLPVVMELCRGLRYVLTQPNPFESLVSEEQRKTHEGYQLFTTQPAKVVAKDKAKAVVPYVVKFAVVSCALSYAVNLAMTEVLNKAGGDRDKENLSTGPHFAYDFALASLMSLANIGVGYAVSRFAPTFYNWYNNRNNKSKVLPFHEVTTEEESGYSLKNIFSVFQKKPVKHSEDEKRMSITLR